ncbi:hypothetical protein CLIB1444_03S04874 [[Candida] jaroonii]|uniref:Uncharacterized protein n=1 Tax=[Candida] jaroonii TaxID=467808 RepID=A0ACA9Y535_9ASCO|nr:hypothetical protein CLIB1444_03S04874 [[Candida] jaroonii]
MLQLEILHHLCDISDIGIVYKLFMIEKSLNNIQECSCILHSFVTSLKSKDFNIVNMLEIKSMDDHEGINAMMLMLIELITFNESYNTNYEYPVKEITLVCIDFDISQESIKQLEILTRNTSYNIRIKFYCIDKNIQNFVYTFLDQTIEDKPEVASIKV